MRFNFFCCFSNQQVYPRIPVLEESPRLRRNNTYDMHESSLSRMSLEIDRMPVYSISCCLHAKPAKAKLLSQQLARHMKLNQLMLHLANHSNPIRRMEFLLDHLEGLQEVLEKNIMPLEKLLALSIEGYEAVLSAPSSLQAQDFIETPRVRLA